MKYDFRFVKYQGCGNDFIIKDEMEGPVTPDSDRSKLARKLCDRHFKVGADGVIFIEKAEGVHGSMRLFEPAGNEADMCGNGLRCVAAYVANKLGKDAVDILTKDGVKQVTHAGGQYRANMGSVRTGTKDLREYIPGRLSVKDGLIVIPLDSTERSLSGYVVNSGEPHVVVRSEHLGSENVRMIGDLVNGDRTRFPDGININFVQVVGDHEIKVRTYERGVYNETMACGTGATASAFVAHTLGWVKPGIVTVHALGGDIGIEFAKDGNAYMTGPAVAEFEGKLVAEV
ncbi:MAG: diaminopimelate epimerase [Thermoplasmatota archaeon]|nr:diaminopimelate epimerase [Candidatus Thermoplasmatota archaeon]MBU1914762.1 diaminopimelate epimerase [Candidatus Thermoplasmatota archaeon]